MKTHAFLTLLFVAALLMLGTGCSKEEIPGPTPGTENPPPKPPTPSDPKPMIPDGDPAESFEAVGKALAQQIELDSPEYGINEKWGFTCHYTYYTFCNASSHSITLLFFTRAGDGGALMEYLLPGQKVTWAFCSTNAFGGISRLYGIVGEVTGMRLYYDQHGDTHSRKGIYEVKYDFNQQFDTADPRDVRQWYYEGFSKYHCNWTYIFTDGDYESAQIASANRTEDPKWVD